MKKKNIAIAGALLTVVLVAYAYADRLYFAIGGEWLVIPLMLLGYEIVRSIKNELKRLLS